MHQCYASASKYWWKIAFEPKKIFKQGEEKTNKKQESTKDNPIGMKRQFE
jgi:hypothetical protein